MEQEPLNPYQAPAAPTPLATSLAPYQGFRESKLFAWLAGLCISFQIPYGILIFLLMEQVVVLPMPTLEAIDHLHTVLFFSGVVFYCIWKYRSACNAQYFSGLPLLYSPGWCVGYYFIPIMMLFRPYQCMKDIYENTYAQTNRSSPNGLVLCWWLVWIFSGIFERVAMQSELPGIAITSQSLTMLSAMLVLWVIYNLTRRQYSLVNEQIMRDHGIATP